jgi:hypothetical protein
VGSIIFFSEGRVCLYISQTTQQPSAVRVSFLISLVKSRVFLPLRFTPVDAFRQHALHSCRRSCRRSEATSVNLSRGKKKKGILFGVKARCVRDQAKPHISNLKTVDYNVWLSPRKEQHPRQESQLKILAKKKFRPVWGTEI